MKDDMILIGVGAVFLIGFLYWAKNSAGKAVAAVGAAVNPMNPNNAANTAFNGLNSALGGGTSVAGDLYNLLNPPTDINAPTGINAAYGNAMIDLGNSMPAQGW